MLSDLTETRIRRYIEQRLQEGASGRTVNLELGNLSRAIGHSWPLLWPKVRKLEERSDIGRALSVEEQARLLEALRSHHTPHVQTLIPLLLLTGMRAGESLSLTWGQVDFLGVLTKHGDREYRLLRGPSRQLGNADTGYRRTVESWSNLCWAVFITNTR